MHGLINPFHMVPGYPCLFGLSPEYPISAAGEAAAAEEAEGLPGAEVPASALERLQQVFTHPRCLRSVYFCTTTHHVWPVSAL